MRDLVIHHKTHTLVVYSWQIYDFGRDLKIECVIELHWGIWSIIYLLVVGQSSCKQPESCSRITALTAYPTFNLFSIAFGGDLR